MRKLIAILLSLLLLGGCASTGGAPETTAAPTTTVTTAAPTETTAAPTTEAPPEDCSAPPGYDHSALAGTWVRTGTEVEGYVGEGGNCTLVFTAVGDGSYLMTYTDRDFPEYNFADKAVQILEEPLYEDCGNDRWMGTVDYVSSPNTTHALTIRDDAVLILQNRYTMDGIPMVSYEFFERVP